MLTHIRKLPTAGWWLKVASCRPARPSTNAPMLQMSPLSWTIGMKSRGGTDPRVGLRQRGSASRPISCPVGRSTIGWVLAIEDRRPPDGKQGHARGTARRTSTGRQERADGNNRVHRMTAAFSADPSIGTGGEKSGRF